MIPYVTSPIEVFAAWLLIDLLTGVYHFVTDRGWNFAHQVEQFRDHHVNNRMLGFDYQPMLAGFPVMLAGVFAESSFLIAAGAFAVLAQIPHYYAHVPNPPAWARVLQYCGLMITPEHHAVHHSGKFDRNFCIFTGWADYLLNAVIAWLAFDPDSPDSKIPSLRRAVICFVFGSIACICATGLGLDIKTSGQVWLSGFVLLLVLLAMSGRLPPAEAL